MSLILDALRKSEAERRRGESPTLYSSLPTPSTRRRPSALRYLPWVAVAVLVAVALFAFRSDEAPATREELSQDETASARREAPAADTGFETAAVVAAAPPAKLAPAPAPAPIAASTAPNVDALVKPPAATAASPASPPAPTPAPEPIPVAPAPAPAAEEQLPPLSVLDTTTRGSLPALKLSMHFYSAEPERRFAIIDGQRVVEGTQLGAGVVTQIRRDGVVIDVAGRRVLLPRP
jgi:general secretion pathway protein B